MSEGLNTCIITGASKGIGASLAERLAPEFDCLILIARSTDRLRSLKTKLQDQAQVVILSGDLKGGRIYKDLPSLIKDKGYKVTAVVHNAGYLVNKPVKALSVEEFEEMYSVNVFAYFKLVKALMPVIDSELPCHWVVTGSMGGVSGTSKFPGLSGYSSSKGAVLIMNEVFASEYAETCHRFNTLNLGAAQTEMLSMAFPGYQAPLSAGEMSEFIAWFVVNGGRFFQGKSLPVALTNP